MKRVLPILPAVLLLLLAGCGERAVGGAGSLAGNHLVVAGTPHQMGVWQGRLLRDRIRDLHARWQGAVLGGGEPGRTFRSACEVYVDQALRRLPEGLRQELDGIAEGAGLAADALLLTELMRDGLRFHDVPPRLRGHLVCDGDGPKGAVVPSGPDAAILEDELILIERRPLEGDATLLVTWPGSLGGLAGASGRGLGYLAVEVPAPTTNQGLAGAPFTVLARRALEDAADAEDLVERLGGGTAWRVLVLDGPKNVRLLGLAQIAAVVTADLSVVPRFVLPPEDEAGEVIIPARAPDASALHALLAGASPHPWWLRWTDAPDAWQVGIGPGSGSRLSCPSAP